MHRIEAENGLLNSRTGHLLAVHGFLVTAFAILSNGKSPTVYMRDVLCLSGVALGGLHLWIGVATMLSIRYWSECLRQIEKGQTPPIPKDLRFDANLSSGQFQGPLTRTVSWIVAAVLPAGMITFWFVAWHWVLSAPLLQLKLW